VKDKNIISLRSRAIALLSLVTFLLAPTAISAQDTDGDGVDDVAEMELGSDPLDDQITPGFFKQGPDLRISYGSDVSRSSYLAWTGREFGVSWEDERNGNFEIYFARLSWSGGTVGPEKRITNDTDPSVFSSLAWTGSEYGLSWQSGFYMGGSSKIHFARLSSQGDTIIMQSRGECRSYPSLAWNGSEFALSYIYVDDEFLPSFCYLYLTRLAPAGSGIGSYLIAQLGDLELHCPGCVRHSLIGAGGEYGMAWKEFEFIDVGASTFSAIQFRRISENGPPTPPKLTFASQWEWCFGDTDDIPSLAWTGSEYGISWKDCRDFFNYYSEIYFTRISSAGAKIGDDVNITKASGASQNPSLTWADKMFAAAFEDDRDGNNEIYFAMISPASKKICDDLRVTFDESSSNKPSLVWTGTEFGVSWEDDRDGNFEIYFTRISLDSDGDGVPDNDERHAYHTDPADWDHDDDGLSDGDEIYAFGTNPYHPDTDADGMNDGDEIAAGRDPLLPDAPWPPGPPPDRPPFSQPPGKNRVDGPFGIECAGSISTGAPANVWSSLLALILPGIGGLGLRSLLIRRRGQRRIFSFLQLLMTHSVTRKS
jgi:hypothetical protein